MSEEEYMKLLQDPDLPRKLREHQERINKAVEGKTWQELCETIAEAHNIAVRELKEGDEITYEQVWSQSPTGELYMIPGQYLEALEVIELFKKSKS